MYGQQFINKHGHEDNGIWLEVLGDLTPKALESGIERLKRVEGGSQFCNFPPNALQFRALCLAYYEELTLPSVGKAFDEIRKNYDYGLVGWTHPVIQYTASKLTVDFLNIKEDYRAFAIFRPIYERVCNLVKQGHELPPLSNKVWATEGTHQRIYEREMGKIKQSLGMKA